MAVCKSYSTSVTVISERPRIANVMKLAINYNVISTIELISQSYIFAEKCGLSARASARFLSAALVRPPGAEDVCREAAQA